MSLKSDPISLQKALTIFKEFKSYLTQKTYIVGSVRRLCDPVFDIDIITSIDNYNIITNLKNFQIVSGLKKNYKTLPKRIFGFFKTSKYFADTPFNIWFCSDKKEIPFLLFTFTGPKNYIIGYRKKAKKLGYLLNEKTLIHIHSNSHTIDIKTEKDIYKFFNKEYKEPWNR